MYDFDCIFLDTCSKRYFDRQILEKSALGGTESSLIRVAEGLGGFGLKIAVVQSQVTYFEPTMGQFAFFMHSNDLPKMRCRNFIQIRGIMNSHLFPKAKKYVWLHDEVDERLKDWNDAIDKYKLHLIGVSRWHLRDIQKYVHSFRNSFIYNPVPDEIYAQPDLELKYDPNTFVWNFSAHKGLGKGLKVFAKIKAKLPDANLIVTHPGYHDLDMTRLSMLPGVAVYGPLACKQLWGIVQSSLCVLYPSDYNETFCCNLAEANALGAPFLSYNRQVLKEVVSSRDQLVEDGNEDALVDRAVEWSTKGRPKVLGMPQFKLSNVIFRWVQLLGGSL